jgi:SAM-dependent methyltransferase
MHKYIILIFSLCAPLHCMEIRPLKCSYSKTPTPQEWPAEEYAKGNQYQTNCFANLLKKHDIKVYDRTVLSVGCGTGEIEERLAKLGATHVHGIDASRNMVEYAHNKYHAIPNLSFEHCFAENFDSTEPYDIALMASSFSFVKNKPLALQRISNSLHIDSILFANIETDAHPESFDIIVLNEMINDIPILRGLLSSLSDPIGRSRPTEIELEDIFSEAGLDMISAAEESFTWTMTEEQWKQTLLPLILSSPAAQKLIALTEESDVISNNISEAQFAMMKEDMTKEEQRQHRRRFFPESNDKLVCKVRKNNFCKYLLNNYFNRCFAKLRQNENGTYTWKYHTTAIMAVKRY